jgi:hypothetical protein
MLGAALASKPLRSELVPEDFSEEDAQEAIREMKKTDKGDGDVSLVKVRGLMCRLGIEVGENRVTLALLKAVKLESRKRRLKTIAQSIQLSGLSDDGMIDDYLKKVSEV